MSMQWKQMIMATAFLSVFGMGAAQATSLVIATEEYPPLNYTKDGEVVGVATGLLKAALKENAIAATITSYPWSRAYDMGLKENGACVYSTTRTPERENLFKWAGPINKNEWVLLARIDSPKIKSLEDAKAYTIGGYPNDALTNYLKGLGYNVDESSTNELNVEKLKAKRIDFWGMTKLQGQSISPEASAEGFKEVLKFQDTAVYLACNKSVSDEIINKLNVTFKRMADDGTIEAAVKKGS